MCGLAADKYGWNKAMFVPLIGFFVSLAFSIYVNTPTQRRELDGFRETKIGYKEEGGGVIGDIKNEVTMEGDRKGSVTYIEMGPNKGQAGPSREL
jgi:hypothetical protein